MAKVSKIYDVLIIGAGAAGLFLAANLRGKSVALLEKNAAPGKKILASGGGRCNVTNRRIAASNYLGDEIFVSNILKNLSFKDVLKFFGELKFTEQKQNQFFCESGSSAVLNVLLKKVEQNGAKIFCGVSVCGARKILANKNGEILDAFSARDGDKNLTDFNGSNGKNDAPNLSEFDASHLQNGEQNLDEIFEVVAENGDKFYSHSLVVASGGLSYKSLGASDVGYKIARDFGAQVVQPAPALVGFTVQKDEFWFKNLSGVCFPAQITVECAAQNCKFDAAGKDGGTERNEDKFSRKDGTNLGKSNSDLALAKNSHLPQKPAPLAARRENSEISEQNLDEIFEAAAENDEFYEQDYEPASSQKPQLDADGKILNRKKGGEKDAKSKQKTQRKFVGDILFTHKGVSGPAVLNASLFWQKGTIEINFCPNFGLKGAQNGKKQLSTILPLPRRFTLEFLRAAGLSDKPFSRYDANEREKISRLFRYRFAPAGTFGFERAEVTRGGVDTDALDVNCGYKGVRGLYFIGETLNVTGMLGGYNLHFAFACAAGLARRLNAL